MRMVVAVFIIMVFGLAALSQTAISPKTDDFNKMSFDVTFDRASYLPVEPVFVTFRFSNPAEAAAISDTPNFLQEARVEVNFNGKTKEINWLSSVTGGGIRFPRTFKSGEFYESKEMLGPIFGWHFTEPGKYEIQFVLRSSDGTRSIRSKILYLTIEDATGINGQALEFLRKHDKYFGSSSWVFSERDAIDLLETFVREYETSVYGELGTLSLAYSYLGKKELERAKFEFEKISSSGNKMIADDAKRSIADIERKIREKS